MKRVDLIKKIQENGATLVRDRGPHTVFRGQDGNNISVPRHNEIGEILAKAIIRQSERRKP
jgi:predicted RNA binding protein YcfA (HicA-like mRNA interferase family)